MLDTAMLPASDWRPPTSLLDLIQQGPDAWQRMRGLVDQTRPASGHPIEAVRWHAPIPRPGKNVFCLGRNYVAHAEEARPRTRTGGEDPDHPGDLHQSANVGHWTVRRHYRGSRGHAAGGLGSRAGRRDRKDRSRHLESGRAPARVRLHGHQRPQCARPAAAAHAMVQRKKPRRVLPDGPARRDRRRVRRSAVQASPAPRSTASRSRMRARPR